MSKQDLIKQANVLRAILRFFEGERARISAILHLAGINEAKLSYAMPDASDLPDKALEALVYALKLSYEHGERKYELPCVKLGAVTYDGVPVLMHPSQCPSIQAVMEYGQSEEKHEELRSVMSHFKGKHPQDAYMSIGATLLTEELDAGPTLVPASNDNSD